MLIVFSIYILQKKNPIRNYFKYVQKNARITMIYRPISPHPYDLGLPKARDSKGF